MKSNDPVLGSKNGEILCRFTSATYERTKNYVPIVNKSSLRGKIPRCIMNSVKIQLALKDTKRGGHRQRKRRHFSVLPEIRSETTGLDFLTGRNLFQDAVSNPIRTRSVLWSLKRDILSEAMFNCLFVSGCPMMVWWLTTQSEPNECWVFLILAG